MQLPTSFYSIQLSSVNCNIIEKPIVWIRKSMSLLLQTETGETLYGYGTVPS